MVLTRSKSNPNAASTAASAPKPAVPSKRKSNASGSKAKVAKTEGATDAASAKEAASAPTEANATAQVADVADIAATATDAAAPAPGAVPTADLTGAENVATELVPPAPTAPEAATIPAPVDVPVVPVTEPVVASTEEPTVHSGAASGSIQPYDAVVSDIEGTTTPIVFVKETLFPYVTSNMKEFLKRNWGSEEMKSAVEALRVQAAKDIADGVSDATPIATESTDVTAEKVQEDVVASIEWQMRIDRKIGALKAFQGYMWKEGYANGALKGDIYDDVIPALDQWKADGKKIYIYSSGSIEAQKLIFGFTVKGDLLHYFSGYFDTTTGPKVEAESYTKIAADIGVSPEKVLFLSDNIHEINAAKKAGLQAVVTDRPGNAPLTTEDRTNNIIVNSFLDIPKPQ
ncbi:HAD-like domain-containing protein [Mortierella sp. GBAus27b]|nr:hypothetical protein BGX31_006218 [Mortierella sp. GBA43]KAI8353058.1 HAD-like domain-containing protein [Mortierella sp. GBAus27b]